MPDVRDVFSAVTERARPDPGGLERQHLRQRRRTRGRRGAAILVAAAIGLAVVGFAVRAAQETIAPTPQRRPTPTSPGPGLHVFDVSTGALTPIEGVPADARDADVSPDGSTIAFVSHETGRDQVYLASIHGGDVRRLTDLPMGASNPSWSPDGSRVAFSGVGANAHTDIYVENADGSRLARLTHDTVEDYHPNWSPDGSRIAFNSIPSFADPTPSFQVRTVGVADRSVSTIARATASRDCLCGLQFADITGFVASWSPNGDRLAFVRPRRSGHSFALQLWTVDPSGHGANLVTTAPPGATASLTWSPDGRSVALLLSTEPISAYNERPGKTDIALVDVATGRTRVVGDAGRGSTRIEWLSTGDRVLTSG
jgi:Tol biopolymer transport system component